MPHVVLEPAATAAAEGVCTHISCRTLCAEVHVKHAQPTPLASLQLTSPSRSSTKSQLDRGTVYTHAGYRGVPDPGLQSFLSCNLLRYSIDLTPGSHMSNTLQVPRFKSLTAHPVSRLASTRAVPCSPAGVGVCWLASACIKQHQPPLNSPPCFVAAPEVAQPICKRPLALTCIKWSGTGSWVRIMLEEAARGASRVHAMESLEIRCSWLADRRVQHNSTRRHVSLPLAAICMGCAVLLNSR